MADKDFVVKNGIVVNTSFSANSTRIALGLTSTNTVISTSTITIGGNIIANSQGANNALYLGGTIASGYQTTAGLAANVAVLPANNASFLGGTAAASYQLNSTLSANVAKLTANNTSFVGSVEAANIVSNAQLSANLSNYTLKAGSTFTGQVNSSANVNVSGGGNINVASPGIFYGNGYGLTNLNYNFQSNYAVDVAVFAGGDSAVWQNTSPKFYPTLPPTISTVYVSFQVDLFIKQVADAVASSGDLGYGGGNPELSYRIVKGTAAGTNTVLFTSEWSTLSTAGSGTAFLTTVKDATPIVGNTIGYAIQYQWRNISADPNANAGTITTANSTTNVVSGTGSYWQGTLNSRLEIAGANSTTNTTPYVKIDSVLGKGSLVMTGTTGFGTKLTASSYRVRDLYANVVMSQTNVLVTVNGFC